VKLLFIGLVFSIVGFVLGFVVSLNKEREGVRGSHGLQSASRDNECPKYDGFTSIGAALMILFYSTLFVVGSLLVHLFTSFTIVPNGGEGSFSAYGFFGYIMGVTCFGFSCGVVGRVCFR